METVIGVAWVFDTHFYNCFGFTVAYYTDTGRVSFLYGLMPLN